ncbi:MAG: threonine synthase [Bacteroidales bacterium]|nr:threonine synthase [Bacteroidales bacterium]MDD3989155.1 threonine synthase [Bacteroidales bacterium]
MISYSYICPACRMSFPADQPVWRCDCGHYLDLEFHPIFLRDSLPDGKHLSGRKHLSDSRFISDCRPLWRYSGILPLDNPANAVSFDEGFTPLVPADYKGVNFLAKMEFLLPTGSFKDRGSAVMISRCRELGIKEIAEDSSGNAACSIAAYCSRASITANLFMPAGNSSGKSIQAGALGAKLHLVEGSRGECTEAALKKAQESYYASHAWNPLFIHGTKTIIYEIVEQLGWRVPDYIFMPVGNGTLLIGIFIGLGEMINAGLIDRMPKLIAVQSDRCAPLKDYFPDDQVFSNKNNSDYVVLSSENGENNFNDVSLKQTADQGVTEIVHDVASPLAEGILVREPIRIKQIIQAIRESGGGVVTVSDAEIKEALKAAFGQGLYIEPTSAAPVAALYKYKTRLDRNEIIVIPLTGSGMKTSAVISDLIR